jgi:hypothetical protein
MHSSMHSAWRLLIVLWLAGVVAAAAQQAQPGSPPATGFRISGKVVDARSGQTLRQCVVQINPTTQRFTAASVTIGEDGAFSFSGLPLGKYALTAAKRGYLPQAYQEHSGFSTAIAVGPDLVSEGLAFRLMPQAIITGTVTDEAGEPVRNAQVRLFEDQDSDGTRSTRTHTAVTTDDRGVYEIPSISPGNYYLAVSAQPWYAQRTPRTEGAPTDASSEALDVAYPTVYYPEATDSEDATPIPVKGGERIEINLTLTPQHAMRLRIATPSSDLNRYSIALQQSVFGQMEPVSIGNMENTGDALLIDGILPGHYEVTMSAANNTTHFTADVASGATNLSEENEEPEVTVTGKVTVEKKIANSGIGLQNRKLFRTYRGPLTDAGEFTINVPPGEYEVIGFIPNHYLLSIASPNAEVKGRVLQVKAGSSPRLDLVAGTGFAHIDGVARLAGHGAGGAMIVLAPDDAKDNRIRFRRDQSDSDGTFSLFDIIPGHYRLYAIEDGWDLEWADPNVLAAFRKKSVPLVIQANDLLRQEVEVQSR